MPKVVELVPVDVKALEPVLDKLHEAIEVAKKENNVTVAIAMTDASGGITTLFQTGPAPAALIGAVARLSSRIIKVAYEEDD